MRSAVVGLVLLVCGCASNPPPAPDEPVPCPPGTAVLVGRVLTAEGEEPVAGARIESWATAEPRPVVTSGADGCFRLEGMPPGSNHFSILPLRHGATYLEVELEDGRETRRDFFVLAGATVEGRIEDVDGVPIQGAVVDSTDANKSELSGPDGRFVVRGLPVDPEVEFSLDVRAAGFEASRIDVLVQAGSDQFVLGPVRLDRPGPGGPRVEAPPAGPWVVRGIVLCDGEPVEGAYLAWRSDPNPLNQAAVTGSDGRFALPGIGSLGENRLYAAKPSMRTDGEDLDEVPPGLDGYEVVFHLERLSTFEGTVRDAAGRAVEGAEVTAYVCGSGAEYGPGAHCGTTRTAADGSFRLPLRRGQYDVEVRKEGYFEESVRGVQVPGTPVAVLLEEGGDFTGRVVDETGAPAAGVEISAGRASGRTGPDGRFRLRGLRRDTSWARISGEGFETQACVGIAPGADEPPLVIPRTCALSGEVLRPDGRTPAKAFRIRVFPDYGVGGVDRRRMTVWGGGEEILPGEYAIRQFSDRNGSFHVDGLRAATVAVEAEANGLLSPLVRDVVLSAGRTVEDLRLVLAPGARIAGSLRFPDGRSIADERLTLFSAFNKDGSGRWQEFEELRWISTDAEGRFEFRAVGEGTYILWGQSCRMEFFEWRRLVEIAPGATVRADVVVPLGGTVRLDAVDSSGKPLPEAWFNVQDAAVERDRAWYRDPREGGENASFHKLPEGTRTGESRAMAGTYQVRVWCTGFRPEDAAFTVKEGETTVVRVVLRPE